MLSLLFVLYCFEIGVFLLLWPWLSAWDRTWSQLPWYAGASRRPDAARARLVSGFGAIHLVWGAHDFELWLRRFRR